MKNNQDVLKLENQVCFPLYVTSRLVTKLYTPMLQELDITYPQYLVLLVLWEQDKISVSDISESLLLESNTLTPLLKRMEAKELIVRHRSKEDERSVILELTRKGKALKRKAMCIPGQILNQLRTNDLKTADMIQLKKTLGKIIDTFKEHELV